MKNLAYFHYTKNMKALLHEFDSRATRDIQKWPNWVRPAMLIATLLGQPIFTVGIGMLVAGIGWGAGNMGLIFAGVIAAATFGACTLAKLYFRRDRPVTEYVARMRFETYSMPSGHAAGAAVSYGLLVVLFYPVLSGSWQYLAGGLMTLFIILIGISRIYLGAHYPSDVIAGWLLGLLGLTTIILVVQPHL
jgi:undecaprenyl-diphosphatase